MTAQLTFLNKMRVASIVERILDIDHADNHFILISAIKLSFRFYNNSKADILKWIEPFLFHVDFEIRSEAYYALGRIRFSEALLTTSFLDFVERLHESREYFVKSEVEIENRIDA